VARSAAGNRNRSCQKAEPRRGDRKRLLQQEVEHIVVEAIRVELELPELLEAIEEQWAKIEKPQEAALG